MNGTRSLDWLIPVNIFSILGFCLHLIVFGEQQTNEMATFVAKNSGGMTKKPKIILKESFFFVLVSTSGASDWQAFKDSHWNNRKTFVFHKIVIYNP